MQSRSWGRRTLCPNAQVCDAGVIAAVATLGELEWVGVVATSAGIAHRTIFAQRATLEVSRCHAQANLLTRQAPP